MLVAKASSLQHPAEGLGRMSLPPAAPSVSVIIPVMNEAKNLPWLFARMPDGVAQIIIVDGRSSDETVDVARQLRPHATIVTQSRRGKGNALACGFAAATGDIVVMLDADGSAHPSEIVRFVRTLMEGAEFAKGSRFLPGGGSSDITRLRRLGNYLLSGLVNFLYDTSYSDLCYGYNAFWRKCVGEFSLPAVEGDEPRIGDGFEIETIINLRAARSRLVIAEVPSYESERLHGASNLNAVTDGLRVLGVVLSERFRSAGTPRVDDQPRYVIPALHALQDDGFHVRRTHTDPVPIRSNAALESPPMRPRAPLDPIHSTSNAARVTTRAREFLS
jgi:glycosyltransferase involved in cell wall biosynthesis